jgi:hypothetical protein
MSKQVAEFDLNTGAVFVNNSIEDFFTAEVPDKDTLENDVEDEDVDDVNTDTEDTDNEDVDDESTDESDEEKPSKNNRKSKEDVDDDDAYADYSEAALFALALKQEDDSIIPIDDINKNLSPKEFIAIVKDAVDKAREEQKELLTERYDEAAKYIEYLISGGNQEVVKQAMSLRAIGDIELTGDEDEKDLEYIVKQGLLIKRIPEKDIADILETYKDKGVLAEKAQDSIEHHRDLDKELLDKAIKQKELDDAQRAKDAEDHRKKVEAVINKGVVKGLPIKDKKRLSDSIFKATENVTGVDANGKKIVYKDTLYNTKYREFNQDIEQQLAFVQLLLDGFDFTKLIDVAKTKVNEDLLDVLNNRTNKKTTRTNSSWFTD